MPFLIQRADSLVPSTCNSVIRNFSFNQTSRARWILRLPLSGSDLRLDFHDCARRYTTRLYLLRGAQSVSTRPCRWPLLDSESDLSDVRGQTRQIRRVRKCTQSCRATIMEGMLQNGNYQREANANTSAMETRKEVKKPPAGSFHHRPGESIHRSSQRRYASSKLEQHARRPLAFRLSDSGNLAGRTPEISACWIKGRGRRRLIDPVLIKSQGGRMCVAIIGASRSASQSSDFPVLSLSLPFLSVSSSLCHCSRNVLGLMWICGNSRRVCFAGRLPGRAAI